MNRSPNRPLAGVKSAQTPYLEDGIIAALQHTLSLQHIVASEAECANIARSLRRISPRDGDVPPRKSA
ncbi:hypothetical protein CAL20_20020 [Bordetella genomosp. 4]|uniref:Uncharacterized protein n=1 Tax=Bordetella genomosp. 4 TaxID=463044 RepID=A0A261TTJ3_9BORD|nr:hypothetical protein CAL21_17150 [Bordetella genomosp. 4]OZI52949.1 hypothetical protein CAL20_20020 [Bordetella genomosp. 4]